MDESIWIYSQPEAQAKKLSEKLGVSLEIAQILVNRNICDEETAYRFLYGTLDDLHDPYLMGGMSSAVERILKAVSKQEKILIFGDYDVDGILSVVCLTRALESLGATVDHFIPDRLREGYGIKAEHLDLVLEKEASLVISVDCGIKAVDFVLGAKEKGIDVIITDHHQAGPALPQALSILNPAVDLSGYPDKSLAGIGVVFKLIQALLLKKERSSILPHYLKLVSIGTISDVATLRGENRLFVKTGLEKLENISNKGLISLLDVCGLKGKKVSVGDVGFRIGPRINAAGRLSQTELAVQLFFSNSLEECKKIAHSLDSLNTERQQVEEKIYNQALQRIKDRNLNKRYRLLIMGSEEWHRGVIGIVASKLKDQFHRPVLLFSYKDGKAFGSGRSIRDFPIIDSLEKNRDFFLNYGGHPMAVGCELLCENMDLLKKAMNIFADSKISDEHLKRKINIDARINFRDVTSSFLEELSLLSPFGVGNPKPVFLTENAVVVAEPRKLKGKHCKFLLKQAGRVFEALGWGKGDWAETIRKGEKVHLTYSFQKSHYMGQERLSLSLEGMKRSTDGKLHPFIY